MAQMLMHIFFLSECFTTEASLWIFNALASVALLPDPDEDDISGGTAGGAELACRGSRIGPLYTEGLQPSNRGK
uniref:Secreted protein n=1 Tax=Oryza meridionalis TaxID=40149 RepID=A0A0E0BXG9_9ORYZ